MLLVETMFAAAVLGKTTTGHPAARTGVAAHRRSKGEVQVPEGGGEGRRSHGGRKGAERRADETERGRG